MKRVNIIQAAALIFGLLFYTNLPAQDSTAATEDAPQLNIALRYFMYNNKIPYVLATTKTKVNGKFQPVKNIGLNIYLDSIAPSNIIGKVRTTDNGEANAVIPASLKNLWDATPSHKFLAVSEANKQFAEANGDLEITKAKIAVDTSTVDSTKNITAKVYEFKDNEWVPVKDVELKIGIRRLGGILPVGKEATYTTDSTGEVTAEFKRDSLPAENGVLTLVVNTDDNDKYGNLVLEENVPWGVKVNTFNDWNKRSLFATRFRSPVWLLIMAYSIIGTVWGVLIYLFLQLIKIRKLGSKIGLEV